MSRVACWRLRVSASAGLAADGEEGGVLFECVDASGKLRELSCEVVDIVCDGLCGVSDECCCFGGHGVVKGVEVVLGGGGGSEGGEVGFG